MNIAVMGLWHLGCVTAASLASVHHNVVGIDFDPALIDKLAAGSAPIFEPGLENMIDAGLKSGTLRFTARVDDLPSDIEILWVAYDTPVDENDVADVEFVIAQVSAILPHLPHATTVLVSSQLPVGSVRRLEDIARNICPEKKLGFACSPENLRLGKALDVFLKPDRIIVGVRSESDQQRIAKMFLPITDRIEWMSVESAEMTKHAINAFLAMSVTFANEIGAICEMVGADAKQVERGLKSESRIGPKAYLAPGAAFAGGTLARDIEFLKEISSAEHLAIPLLESVKVSNDHHKTWIKRKLTGLFSDLTGIPVAVWGLTYKAGTDTLRRSLAVELCNWLIEQGARVTVHDPMAGELPGHWNGLVHRSGDAVDALAGARVLVIGTEWPEYKQVSAEKIDATYPGLVVLDPNRFLPSLATAPHLRYVAVGTPTC